MQRTSSVPGLAQRVLEPPASRYGTAALIAPATTRIVGSQLTPRDTTPRRGPVAVGPPRDVTPTRSSVMLAAPIDTSRLVRCSTTPRLIAREASLGAQVATSAIPGAIFSAPMPSAASATPPAPVFEFKQTASFVEARSPSYVPPVSQAPSYVPPPVIAQNHSYVAPPVTQTGSFVAPPVTQAGIMPPAGTTVVLPQTAVPQVASLSRAHAAGAPPAQLPSAVQVQAEEQISLTRGLPDPIAIDVQKAAWNRRLDDQLRYEEELLKMQQRQQTALIHQAAEAQKRHAILEIEQRAKQQEFSLTHQCSEQMMGMQKELQSLKLMLEKQASDLLMEYQQRKSQEEILQAQFKAHRKAYDMQFQMAAELQKTQQEARTAQAALLNRNASTPVLEMGYTNGTSSNSAMLQVEDA